MVASRGCSGGSVDEHQRTLGLEVTGVDERQRTLGLEVTGAASCVESR